MQALNRTFQGAMGDDHDWNRQGSFVKKPTTGWLHDDAALMNGDGIYYPVKVRFRDRS